MQKQFKLTAQRLEELKAELEHLKTVREKEVAEQIKEARSFGDLSENSEYDEAKNEQGKLYSRIAEVENIIAHAVIIEGDVSAERGVSIGAKVQLRFDDGREVAYTVVGSQEADPKSARISDESPIGKALMGCHIGDKVTIEAPSATFHCEILNISRE